MAYLTAAIAKSDWLDVESGDTTHDALIGRLIAYAEKLITSSYLCNQPIEQETVSYYTEGNGKQMMPLPYHTIPVSLTSITSRDDYGDSFAAITGTGVIVTNKGVPKVYLENGWSDLQYLITLAVGYTAGNIPQDIHEAGYELVKEMYLHTIGDEGQDRFGVTSVSTAANGVTLTKAITPIIERVRPRLWKYVYIPF